MMARMDERGPTPDGSMAAQGRPLPPIPNEASGLRPYLATLAAVATALFAAWLLRPIAGLESVDLVLLTPIIAVAARYGLRPSLFGCLASVLAYNFFFIPPLYTFAVADPANVVRLLAFLLVAVVTSNLAARVRAEASVAQRRAYVTEALYAFSRGTAGILALDELLQATANRIGSMLGARVVLLMPDATGYLRPCAGWPATGQEDEATEGAQLAWEANRPGAQGRNVMRVAGRLFLPLRTSQRVIGIVCVARDGADTALNREERSLLDALLAQAAAAVDRIRLGQERDEARLAAEAERLRSALLASLSHDLKTPLTSITGAVTALRQYDALYDAAARDELAATIQDEAERLGRFVTNLLDMTRLQVGGIVLDRQPVDVGEVVGTALQRTAPVLAGHRVVVGIGSDLPLLDLDVVLFEQVLVNLLDNAAKYAPLGSTVAVEGRRAEDAVVLRVIDEGPGLAPGDEERVFETFYRAGKGDRQRAGTGLGLAICHGFMEALGGTIRAANRLDRSGAVFTIMLPEPMPAAPPRHQGAPG
jgi:K+-sensing histidine kinase KdpD